MDAFTKVKTACKDISATRLLGLFFAMPFLAVFSVTLLAYIAISLVYECVVSAVAAVMKPLVRPRFVHIPLISALLILIIYGLIGRFLTLLTYDKVMTGLLLSNLALGFCFVALACKDPTPQLNHALFWVFGVSRVLVLFMLLGAMYPNHHYFYFELLRYVVVAHLLFDATSLPVTNPSYRHYIQSVLAFGVVLFNPIWPIHADRSFWIRADATTFFVLLATSLILVKEFLLDYQLDSSNGQTSKTKR